MSILSFKILIFSSVVGLENSFCITLYGKVFGVASLTVALRFILSEQYKFPRVPVTTTGYFISENHTRLVYKPSSKTIYFDAKAIIVASFQQFSKSDLKILCAKRSGF